MDLLTIFSIYLTLILRISVVVAIDCQNFQPGICQPDSLQYCLTDGQVIQGTCEASNQVCTKGKVLDESFLACASTITENMFNCTGYVTGGPCQPDLITYCFTTGQKVVGSCLAKAAVCENGLEIDITEVSCQITTTLDPFDCTDYIPDVVCRPDMNEYCLSNGLFIKGLCEAKKLICRDGLKVDISEESCKVETTTPDMFDCTGYTAVDKCTDDTNIYCLTDGTVIVGFCKTREAICGDGKTLDKDSEPCSTASQCVTPFTILIMGMVYLFL